MTSAASIARDIDRYRALGVVANPFAPAADGTDELGLRLEIAAHANRLVSLLDTVARTGDTRPIVIAKTTAVPAAYHLRAVSQVEAAVGNDDNMGTLHAYVQLYMMRRGRVRATLAALSERLIFRSFDKTMAAFIERVLVEPDSSLASYQVLDPEVLAEFTERFHEDPLGVFAEYFGEMDLERKGDLAQIPDIRLTNLDADAEELETTPEVDSGVPDAPGTGFALGAEGDAPKPDERHKMIVDYVVEYAATHVSPVIGRAVRVYVDRGLAAASMEMRVTKAPRKTLSAVVDLARMRFSSVALIFDGFESWVSMEPDLRQSVVITMTEMRWLLDGRAVMLLGLERGQVAELEEAFSAATKVDWDFRWIAPLQDEPTQLVPEMVDEWLASAALAGTEPLTLQDPVLARIAEKAGGDLIAFALMACAAVESAADRAVASLDDEAWAAALVAGAGEE